MRRLRALAPLLLLLLGVVAGCTGTTENVPPLLLAIGRQDPANAAAYQMVLVEDNYTANQSTLRTLTIVAGSERPLPYPAIASDVVDRAGARTSMVVLTRDLAPGTDPPSALVSFGLTGIDPAAPTAFQELSTIPLTGAGGALQAYAPLCLTGLTVSATGRYVTLLSDPRACNDTSPSGYAQLFQLDTQTGSAQPVVPASGVQVTQPTVPFDDQQSTGETLSFLVSGTNNAQVYTDPVPHDASLAAIAGTLPGQDQLALEGSGGVLAAATNPSPYTPNSYLQSYLQTVTPGLLTPAGTQVDTVFGATALAIDPSGATSQVVVAGYSSGGAGEIAVHPDPGTKATAFTPYVYGLTGVAAAIDPVNRFAYVVDNERIVVLDLLTVASQQGIWYKSYPFSTAADLPLPTDSYGRYVTTVQWARAKPTPP